MNRINPSGDPPPPGYLEKIRELAEAAKVYMAAHPKEDIRIQFNYPSNTNLIAVVTDALERGFITANPAGRRMLDAIGATETGKKAPSAIMLRFALENMEEIAP